MINLVFYDVWWWWAVKCTICKLELNVVDTNKTDQTMFLVELKKKMCDAYILTTYLHEIMMMMSRYSVVRDICVCV